MKVLAWNIHGAASLGWNNKCEIRSFVVDEILSKKVDIFILTEFVVTKGWDYFQSKLEEENYAWFITHTTSQNGILIAVNRDIEGLSLKDIESFQANQISAATNGSESENPDFLKVAVKINNKPLTIIGARIRIGTGDEKDLENRKDQLQSLAQYAGNTSGAVLIAGDLNNGKYQRTNWNWDLIEGSFGKDFTIHTPISGFSWKKNGYENGFSNDHIIAKGITVTEPQYSWEFMKRDEAAYDNGNNFNPKVGYPDHAILTASIEIK